MTDVEKVLAEMRKYHTQGGRDFATLLEAAIHADREAMPKEWRVIGILENKTTKQWRTAPGPWIDAEAKLA